MDASLQLAISMGVPTLAVMVGILINNSRLSDLRSHMDKRFDDIKRPGAPNSSASRAFSMRGGSSSRTVSALARCTRRR